MSLGLGQFLETANGQSFIHLHNEGFGLIEVEDESQNSWKKLRFEIG